MDVRWPRENSLICFFLVIVILLLAGCINQTAPSDLHTDVTKPTSPLTTIDASNHVQTLNVTIHSVQKVRIIQGVSPATDHVWVIVDLSLENQGFTEGLLLTPDDMLLIDPATGRTYPPRKDGLHLVDTWTWEPIADHRTKRGELLFSPDLTPNTYLLRLMSPGGSPLIEKEITASRYREYSHTASQTKRELVDEENFTAVVNQLTTPEKTLQYMVDSFIFTYHDGVVSYPAEEFFKRKKGDCKDYATFFSYVLDQHGYYSEIVSIKYPGSGHAVAVFRDDDGELKYMSSDKMNGFRNVSSIEDLLEKEAHCANAGPVLRYRILPAGTVNMCTFPSGEC